MYLSYQTFTVQCSGSTEGTEVTRSGQATSIISQRDADVKALGLARELAFRALECSLPPGPATTIYYSAAVTASADSEAGYVPETFSVTLSAGAVYSTLSQADADAAAAIAAQVQADQKRDAEQRPLYYNSAQTYEQSCGPGYQAYTATVTVAANAVSSEVSKADADATALEQAIAAVTVLLASNCVQLFYSEVQTYTASCTTPGEVGADVTVTYAAGHTVSTVSVADANATALAEATAAAEALLSCTAGYYNTEQTSTKTCNGEYGPNWIGEDSEGIVPAGTYSAATQVEADALALAAAEQLALDGLYCYWGGGVEP